MVTARHCQSLGRRFDSVPADTCDTAFVVPWVKPDLSVWFQSDFTDESERTLDSPRHGAARACPWLSTALIAGSVRRGKGEDRQSQRRSQGAGWGSGHPRLSGWGLGEKVRRWFWIVDASPLGSIVRKPRDRKDSPISGNKRKQHTHREGLDNLSSTIRGGYLPLSAPPFRSSPSATASLSGHVEGFCLNYWVSVHSEHFGCIRNPVSLSTPGWVLTSSVGQSEWLLIPRSSVRFRQKLRTQICMDLSYIDPQSRVLNYCFK